MPGERLVRNPDSMPIISIIGGRALIGPIGAQGKNVFYLADAA
jgi:hypothetical protein